MGVQTGIGHVDRSVIAVSDGVNHQFAFGVFLGFILIGSCTDGLKSCRAAAEAHRKADEARFQSQYQNFHKKQWDTLKAECAELCRIKMSRATAVNRFGCMCADGTVTPIPGGLPR